MSKPVSLYFLCIHNRCRSQMAEGFARHFGGYKVIAESAGLEKSEIHPLTIQVMKEISIDISQQTSKKIDMQKFLKANTIIKMCEQIKERCPVVPFGIQNIQMDIPDPSPTDGSLGSIEDFRKTRDLIKDKVFEMLRCKNLLVADQDGSVGGHK